ncbi:cobIalamin adenosyltransferase protein [Ralstonia solanacearum IPO1609]|uniref:CobIalamin adenosyltransferase protein n=2 Tax=Ralstonia solanacearum TaxID=305 RepID=A0A7U7JDZ9_RALSL|nr:cobIalamin adenosyltransferase protein [Ralstonia solanacearum IPO1609]
MCNEEGGQRLVPIPIRLELARFGFTAGGPSIRAPASLRHARLRRQSRKAGRHFLVADREARPLMRRLFEFIVAAVTQPLPPRPLRIATAQPGSRRAGKTCQRDHARLG